MADNKKKMFEIRPGQHRPKLLRNGALFGLFLALATYVMYFRPPIPVLSSKGYKIQADLADGTNIRPGFTPVRIGGITVGQVVKQTDLSANQGVRITIEMGKGTYVSPFKGKVYKDATANNRWRTLLGRNDYIDLDVGSKSAGVLDGPIPKARTGGQVELDTAISPLDKDGRQSFGSLIDTFNDVFKKPEAFQSALRSVAPSMKTLAPALSALTGTRPGDLPDTVKQTSRALAALNRNDGELADLVTSGRIALGVTAAKRADLGATLRTAPAALRQTRSTMVRLRQTLDEVDPTADQLRPGARVLDETAVQARGLLRQATPLLVDARPTFRDLAPALRSARKAGKAGTPAITGLQPTLDRTVSTLIPFFDETHPESRRKNFQMIGPTLSAASSVVARGDKRGALATFHAGAGENFTGFSPCKTRFTDPRNTPLEAVNCEVLTRIITGAYTGQEPAAVRMKNSAVPDNVIKPLLEGAGSITGAAKKLGELTKDVSNITKASGASKRGGR